MIGETLIDVEDRYFAKSYRDMENIPIETIKLMQPSSSMPRGRIQCWVDIIPANDTSKR